MEARNRCLLLCAIASAILLGACAHQPAVKTETTKAATPPPPAPPQAMPAATSTSDRAKVGDQDVMALLQQSIIHFAFDSAQLTPESQSRLQKVAEALSSRRAVQIQIAGHCDDRGTEEYNLALGQKRAEVAKKYLVSLGVDPSQIRTISYGEDRPLDPRDTEEAWAANRRDEFAAMRGP